jgi:hypothetical protein
VAQILQSGKATLIELREKYSLQDMMNIWEVVYTGKYNEWQRAERARQEQKMRK